MSECYKNINSITKISARVCYVNVHKGISIRLRLWKNMKISYNKIQNIKTVNIISYPDVNKWKIWTIGCILWEFRNTINVKQTDFEPIIKIAFKQFNKFKPLIANIFPTKTIYKPICKFSYNNKGIIKNTHIYIKCTVPVQQNYNQQIYKWKQFLFEQQLDKDKRFISIKPNWMFDQK